MLLANHMEEGVGGTDAAVRAIMKVVHDDKMEDDVIAVSWCALYD